MKAQLTCDGYHVAKSWVKLIIKTKGLQNVYGVTDQSHCSGLEDGVYTMADGSVITAKDGLIYGADGYINSGNNTMNQTMKKAHDLLGLTMEEVGSLYAENVALCLDIKDRGKIEVGRMSDFTLMDKDYNVLKTIIDGEVYYENN